MKTRTTDSSMKYLLSLAVSLAVCYLSIADDRCSEHEYQPHPTDCTKYLRCIPNNEGVLETQERPCAFPTFWNQTLLACDSYNRTLCPADKCQNEPSGYRYKGEGNCRGYWECAEGKSVPMCCSYGQYYNETRGCVDNDEEHKCLDSCLDEIATPENKTTANNETVTKNCTFTAVPGDPSRYAVNDPSRANPILMPCSPGTAFNQDTCQCSDLMPVQDKENCKRELYLSFDHGKNDQSGENVHVDEENVVFQNGKAYFNGNNSKLVIPRFNNVWNVKTIVIKVNYTSAMRSRSETLPRAIISNGYKCPSPPTVLISEDYDNLYFGVGTTKSAFNYTYIERQDMGEQKQVVLKYDGKELTGMEGKNKAQIEIEGDLRLTQCSFTVGFSENLAPFVGSIDDLEIYFCNPGL